MTDSHALFDDAFARRAPALECRARQAADLEFLTGLAIACSPLAGMLPEAMLVQQAEFQHAAHDGAHPDAMQRIVVLDRRPIARIMVDWMADESYGVDIAVLPDFRATGAGLHMLRAWIEIADTVGLPCRLDVRIDNPAARIYARIGFRRAPGADPFAPIVTMLRAPNERSGRAD